MKIDIHAHILPPKNGAELFKRVGTRVLSLLESNRILRDLATRFRIMEVD